MWIEVKVINSLATDNKLFHSRSWKNLESGEKRLQNKTSFPILLSVYTFELTWTSSEKVFSVSLLKCPTKKIDVYQWIQCIDGILKECQSKYLGFKNNLQEFDSLFSKIKCIYFLWLKLWYQMKYWVASESSLLRKHHILSGIYRENLYVCRNKNKKLTANLKKIQKRDQEFWIV